MDPLMYTQMSILNAFKGNFLLAECNKICGKCFSHTPLGSGYRSCDRKAGSCFCCVCPPLWRYLFFPFLEGAHGWVAHLRQQLAAKSENPWILQALNVHSAMQLLTPNEGKAVISRHFFFYRGVLLLMVWPYFSLLALDKKSKVTSLLRFTWQSIWKFSKQLCHHEKWIWTLLRNFITEFLNQWYYNSSTGICKEKRKNETGQL